MVITDIKMPDMDGIEAALAITRETPVPIILLSGHHDDALVNRAASANVMAYLIKPISEADLRTAIPLALARFKQIQALTTEAAGLRQALEDRKIIEKAKGILMKRLSIDEQDAFRRIRMLASSQNRKLIDVCRQIVTVDEVFAQLEAIGASGSHDAAGPPGEPDGRRTRRSSRGVKAERNPPTSPAGQRGDPTEGKSPLAGPPGFRPEEQLCQVRRRRYIQVGNA